MHKTPFFSVRCGHRIVALRPGERGVLQFALDTAKHKCQSYWAIILGVFFKILVFHNSWYISSCWYVLFIWIFIVAFLPTVDWKQLPASFSPWLLYLHEKSCELGWAEVWLLKVTHSASFQGRVGIQTCVLQIWVKYSIHYACFSSIEAKHLQHLTLAT